MAAAMVFLAQTIPVAAIISLTEDGKLLRIWSSIFQLSFPYYLLSAGIASIVTTVGQHVGWQIPLLVLPAMYGVFRSYKLYFGGALPLPHPIAMAKSAEPTAKPPQRAEYGKHQLPEDCRIRTRDILCGLHHEYWLEKVAA
jgi:hypothetical protein